MQTGNAEKLGYANGGKIRCMAEGGLITGFLSKFRPKTSAERYAEHEAAQRTAPPAAPASAPSATPAPMVSGALDPKNALRKREQAAGLAKGGPVPRRPKGATRHPQAKGKDTVPLMGQPGEFMVKKAAVDHVGVGFMKKLNTIADGGKVPAKKKARGAVRHMEAGGLVEEELRRRVAPYVNHRAPSGPPAMPPPLGLPNNAPPPANAVATTPYKPNFTMGTAPAGVVEPPFTDVQPKRAPYNPVNGSPEARAWQASRAAPPAAAPSAAAAPRSGAFRTGQAVGGALRRAGGALGTVGRAVLPIAAATSAVNAGTTATEDYETRFGFGPSTIENNELRAVRDVGVRALGAASDLGNAMTGGLAGNFYRDKQQPAAQPTAQTTATAPAPAPRGALPARAGVSVVAPAQGAEPVNNQVTRVGNSYSGAPGVSGDIVINGAKPRGGAIAPQDNQAAENLARRYGQTSGFGNATAGNGTVSVMDTSQGYAQDLRDIERLQAARQPDPIAQLMDNGRPMTARKLGAISKARSDAAEATNLNADRTVARAGASLDNQAKAQLLAASTKLTTAKTAAERLKATDELQALQGKWQKELPNRFTVVPGGQEIDQATQTAVTRPARVLDNQTGQFIDQQPQQGGQKLETNKVYTDARGNRARWDGSKFVPV